MKPLGIVRKIDQLGRIVIPMEVRRVHGWETGTPIEMFATEKGLVLREYGAEQKKLAILEELEYLKNVIEAIGDETALTMLSDITDYVKGDGKS
ncbi:AbrB/MazE/SpoVT family DNA-binding domain-containing protein [Parageobacillus thermoglucosidasius]|uniref:AbrB/MazE/SpoVT family DNA-binding domain-containing protein n=1 Tax=Parageobacillus thermoglucosidasius TaxID=1426 RepID=UPI0001D17356|nr:AbrB/MazE/SpoVT family DNA-binding domain-containing protein [Parageobacillus thermoglucosidasius]AEH46749.1 SpoVT/AbrB domain-containing protein [Parageobacillus thermoglucosidasius C56-YS93]